MTITPPSSEIALEFRIKIHWELMRANVTVEKRPIDTKGFPSSTRISGITAYCWSTVKSGPITLTQCVAAQQITSPITGRQCLLRNFGIPTTTPVQSVLRFIRISSDHFDGCDVWEPVQAQDTSTKYFQRLTTHRDRSPRFYITSPYSYQSSLLRMMLPSSDMISTGSLSTKPQCS